LVPLVNNRNQIIGFSDYSSNDSTVYNGNDSITIFADKLEATPAYYIMNAGYNSEIKGARIFTDGVDYYAFGRYLYIANKGYSVWNEIIEIDQYNEENCNTVDCETDDDCDCKEYPVFNSSDDYSGLYAFDEAASIKISESNSDISEIEFPTGEKRYLKKIKNFKNQTIDFYYYYSDGWSFNRIISPEMYISVDGYNFRDHLTDEELDKHLTYRKKVAQLIGEDYNDVWPCIGSFHGHSKYYYVTTGSSPYKAFDINGNEVGYKTSALSYITFVVDNLNLAQEYDIDFDNLYRIYYNPKTIKKEI